MGRDTWRPNRDLETRDSVRKRTPKDGRRLTKTKGVKLFRSPREPAASGSKIWTVMENRLPTVSGILNLKNSLQW
ncbi:uncharacterized protein LOC144338645 isoform X2 [Macaca mulatta]